MVWYPFVNLQIWKGMGAIAILLAILTLSTSQKTFAEGTAPQNREGLYRRDGVISPRDIKAELGLYQAKKVPEIDS